MGILGNIDRCLHALPHDLMTEKVIYIELDKENYVLLQSEITTYTSVTDLKFIEQKVEDFGTCSILGYNGYKVIVALSKNSKKVENFFLAFRVQLV